MRFWSLLLILLLIIPLAHAKSGKMSLLTVSGAEHNQGGIADLYLEIKPGTGTIFIDSFPLTKLDTQISTRFANEVACDFLEMDCSKYDFFYTIRAKATIVGGPSAGAAMTVLTISLLADLDLDEKAIMTGTINSGGLVGPVAGINEKVEAAVDNGFTKVLVPKWQSSVNVSKIEEKGLDDKITIVKVKNLEEALYHMTGKDFSVPDEEVAVSKQYSDIMNSVSKILCDRTEDILNLVEKDNSTLYVSSEEFYNRSFGAEENQDYYSKASFCFSANLRLRTLEFQNKSQEELLDEYKQIIQELDLTGQNVNNFELISLADLETYMIVKERLFDAQNYLEQIDKNNISSSNLAYAKERVFSGVAWSEFFALGGSKIELDEDHLNTVCLKKISEAEERSNYAELYVPMFINGVKESINESMQHYRHGDFALCIFKASKAKAEANILLTAISINEEDMEKVLEEKLESLRKVILLQEKKEIFPIIGYSYFEYSNSLVEYELASALTFAEYALELSKLDMYFPKEDKLSFYVDPVGIQIFLFGFVVGAATVMIFRIRKRRKSRY